MRPVAYNQSTIITVNAVRCLSEGPHIEALLTTAPPTYIAMALVWTAALLAVFTPLAPARPARRYKPCSFRTGHERLFRTVHERRRLP